MQFNNTKKTFQKKNNSYQGRSMNLEVYTIACQIVMKTYQERPSGSKSHEEIVAEAYAKAEKLFASGVCADRLGPDGSKTPFSFSSETANSGCKAAMNPSTSGSKSPANLLESPTSSGYASEEDIPQAGPSSGYSSGTDSGLSSGAVSPSPATESTKKITFGKPGIDFVFNIGATNAFSSCHRTIKVDLGDGSFEMIVGPNGDVPKKIKVFTKEELDRQAEIVAEFKRNIMGSS